ncbi:MAG: hypothetical protein ACOYY2_02550 [Actinomycetota bacterium]
MTGAAAGALTGTAVDWVSAWTAALDELELDVAAAEALLADRQHLDGSAGPLTPGGWQPPQLGPIPGELRPRAQALLDRQLATAAALTLALAGARRQLALTRRLQTGDDGGRPLFVDTAG